MVFKKILHNSRGNTTAEYSLLSALIAVGLIAGVAMTGDQAQKSIMITASAMGGGSTESNGVGGNEGPVGNEGGCSGVCETD